MKYMRLFTAVALVVSPRIAEAQRQNDLGSLRYALLAHAEGTGLRIRTEDGTIYGTSSYRLVGPAFVVNDTVMPSMETVTHVWRRNHGAKRGAIIGVTAGGLLGVAAGSLLVGAAGGFEGPHPTRNAINGAAIGVALGGLAGAVLGTAIGEAIPTWKLVWQRDPK